MIENKRKILLLIAVVSIAIGILLLAIPTITADDLRPTRQKVVGTGYYETIEVDFNGEKFEKFIYGTLNYKDKEAYVCLELNRMLPIFNGYAVYKDKRYDIFGIYLLHENLFYGAWQIGCFSGYMQAIIN